MRYQLSWHTNQSLDAPRKRDRKASSRAKWMDRYQLSWHTDQSLAHRTKDREGAARGQWQNQLNNFWHETRARLLGAEAPQVWQSINAAGKVTWNAYDAGREQAIYNVSEAELRSWLENLHYRA
jgi:hypothetical protein